jgi:hypothetical protein
MKGLQRTCASARYTRLIVLPRFLCVWLRNSHACFPEKSPTPSGFLATTTRNIRDPNLRRDPRPKHTGFRDPDGFIFALDEGRRLRFLGQDGTVGHSNEKSVRGDQHGKNSQL